MTVALRKWGNSLAIRIPKDLVNSLKVDKDSEMELKIVDGALIVTPHRNNRLETLVAKINSSNLHKETETGMSVGKEEW